MLTLIPRTVGPWPMNTYALLCPETRQSVLFDPGADPDTLAEMVANTTPIAILLTHTHPDHVMELATMRQRLGVPVMSHPGPHFINFDPQADRLLDTGDTVQVGNYTCACNTPPATSPIRFVSFWRMIIGLSWATRFLRGGRGVPGVVRGFR